MSKKIEELREIILTWLREVYYDYYDEDADRKEIKPLISAILSWHNKHQRELDKKKMLKIIQDVMIEGIEDSKKQCFEYLIQSFCNGDIWKEEKDA